MANKNESFISVLKRNLNGLCECVNEQLFESCRDWYWIGGFAGGLCCFDDNDFLTVEEMLIILEQDVDYDTYMAWHCAELDHPEQHINLHSWLMGARYSLYPCKHPIRALYIIQTGREEYIDYDEHDILHLSDDFLRSHFVGRFFVTALSEPYFRSLGKGKGFGNYFRFRIETNADREQFNTQCRTNNNLSFIALIDDGEGMRVFYAPHYGCHLSTGGKDRKHYTFILRAAPTRKPIYHADVTARKLDDFVEYHSKE